MSKSADSHSVTIRPSLWSLVTVTIFSSFLLVFAGRHIVWSVLDGDVPPFVVLNIVIVGMLLCNILAMFRVAVRSAQSSLMVCNGWKRSSFDHSQVAEFRLVNFGFSSSLILDLVGGRSIRLLANAGHRTKRTEQYLVDLKRWQNHQWEEGRRLVGPVENSTGTDEQY